MIAILLITLRFYNVQIQNLFSSSNITVDSLNYASMRFWVGMWLDCFQKFLNSTSSDFSFSLDILFYYILSVFVIFLATIFISVLFSRFALLINMIWPFFSNQLVQIQIIRSLFIFHISSLNNNSDPIVSCASTTFLLLP